MCSLIAVSTENKEIASIMLFLGFLVIFMISLFTHKRRYGSLSCVSGKQAEEAEEDVELGKTDTICKNQ